MNLSSKSLVVSVVLVAGVLGGTAAYRVAALADGPQPAARESLVVDSTQEPAAGPAGKSRQPGFAPCRKPARLEGDTCVTDEVRTVALAAPAVGRAPAPASSSGHHDDAWDDDRDNDGDDDGDDDGHHGGDDDRDDDHGHHDGDDRDDHHDDGHDDDSHHGGDDD